MDEHELVQITEQHIGIHMYVRTVQKSTKAANSDVIL